MADNQAPHAARDVEMNQYIADRGRVNEDKLRQDDEIIEQFGEYGYGWHDSDAAGEAAKKASMRTWCVRSRRTSTNLSGCSTCVCAVTGRS